MAETNGEPAGNSAENSVSTTATEASEGQNGQVAGNPQAQQPEQNRLGFWSVAKTLIVRCVIIYMITSFIRGRTSPQPANTTDKKGEPVAYASQNMFPKDTVMDMYVYINEEQKFTQFGNDKVLFWHEEELMYGDWTSGLSSDGSYERRGVIEISENVQNNKSIYMHIFFVKAGRPHNPQDEDYSRMNVVQKSKCLNKYKKRKYHDTFNLLTGETKVHPDMRKTSANVTSEILSHWHPNLTVNLVDDHTPWTPGAVPAPLDEYIDFEAGTGFYKPILFFNDYWNLNHEYMPINSTTPKLNLTLTYSPMSLFKWQMYAAQTMRSRWYSFMGDTMEESDEEQDTLKQTFLDTNPYLLGLTIIVSLVHSVFEFLAFKNDIQFWRNRKTLEGLSVRSVFFSVFQSVIVLLYVLDNDTNFVVRVSVFIGLGIEIWKIQKVLDIKVNREEKWLGLVPKIQIRDKSTYVESETKKYDKLAFSYLSWLLYPLLVGYAIYSVLYLEHKSWYSWVLNMLYGFLLTFGFIMMTPQLFINYKLKSVAHLPWRMLTYKALNTFIDDLFAFVIKMPTLYRLGCFRDDIIFLIYLYQRYIYKVDLKRVNEFGISGDMTDKSEQTPQIEASDNAENEAETKDLTTKKNE